MYVEDIYTLVWSKIHLSFPLECWSTRINKDIIIVVNNELLQQIALPWRKVRYFNEIFRDYQNITFNLAFFQF